MKIIPCVSVTVLTLTIFLMNPLWAKTDFEFMLHNSGNLGTKYGTWGAGYTCASCHVAKKNIKLVNYSIATPTGKRLVNFSRMTSSFDTIGILGDDLRTNNLDASRNICEVCHHRTAFHQYSATKLPNRATNNHMNRSDCMQCHAHRTGFMVPVCGSCHGNPPATAALGSGGLLAPVTGATSPATPGAHAHHVGIGMTCDICHNGSAMPSDSNSIQIGFAMNGATWAGFSANFAYGSFSGHAPLNAPYGTVISSNAGTSVNSSASYRNSCNVYCHGQWPGSKKTINPSWVIINGSQKQCGTCHGTSQLDPLTTGNHPRHAGVAANQLGLACTACHGTLATSSSHVNGRVKTSLNTNSNTFGPAAKYKGFANQSSVVFNYGNCTTIYCHGTSGAPIWGGAPLACNSCHNAKADDAYWKDNSSHALHWEGTNLPASYAMAPGNSTGDATTYRFACSSCHSAGKGASHANGPADANGSAQVHFGYTSANKKGTYNYGVKQVSTDNGFAWSDAAGSGCNTTYCHSDGNGSDGMEVGWLRTTNSDAQTQTQIRCLLCHSYNAMSTGHHAVHVTEFDCGMCHYETSASVNQITDKSKHVNKKKDVKFNPTNPGTFSGRYDAQTRTCSSLNCHVGINKIW